MELKFCGSKVKTILFHNSNRTFMELKYGYNEYSL